MSLTGSTPQLAAALCLIAAVAVEVLGRTRRRREGRRRTQGRASSAVLFGAYCIGALALVGPASADLAVPHWLAWTGAALAAAGVALRVSLPARRGACRTDRAGNVLAWAGIALAAGNALAAATIVVAMLAAYAADPASGGRVAPGDS